MSRCDVRFVIWERRRLAVPDSMFVTGLRPAKGVGPNPDKFGMGRGRLGPHWPPTPRPHESNYATRVNKSQYKLLLIQTYSTKRLEDGTRLLDATFATLYLAKN